MAENVKVNTYGYKLMLQVDDIEEKMERLLSMYEDDRKKMSEQQQQIVVAAAAAASAQALNVGRQANNSFSDHGMSFRQY